MSRLYSVYQVVWTALPDGFLRWWARLLLVYVSPVSSEKLTSIYDPQPLVQAVKLVNTRPSQQAQCVRDVWLARIQRPWKQRPLPTALIAVLGFHHWLKPHLLLKHACHAQLGGITARQMKAHLRVSTAQVADFQLSKVLPMTQLVKHVPLVL